MQLPAFEPSARGMSFRARRSKLRFRYGIDVVLAVVLATSWWWQLAAQDNTTANLGLSFVLAGLASLPVAIRTRFPRSCLAVSSISLAVLLLVGNPAGATAIGVAFIAYTVITTSERSTLLPVLAIGVALETLSWFRVPNTGVQSIALDALLIGAFFLAAQTARTRQQNMALLQERTERIEQERAVSTQRAVTDERSRIARELHDIVAHSMSQISVQSGMGRMLAATQPHRAVESLRAIEQLSHDALVEMRRLTGALRDDNPQDLRPHAGFADVEQLLASVRQSGVEAELSVVGEPRQLPATLDRAVYRIVQESLTNVVKHASPTSADVTITFEDDRIAVTTTDAGARRGAATRAPSAPGGHGIIGMRERARTLGGELTWGPVGAGYRVNAVMPIDGLP